MILSSEVSMLDVIIMYLVGAVAVSLLMAHEQKQNRKLLHSERKRLEAWAEARAEQLAEERIREMQRTEKLKKIGR